MIPLFGLAGGIAGFMTRDRHGHHNLVYTVVGVVIGLVVGWIVNSQLPGVMHSFSSFGQPVVVVDGDVAEANEKLVEATNKRTVAKTLVKAHERSQDAERILKEAGLDKNGKPTSSTSGSMTVSAPAPASAAPAVPARSSTTLVRVEPNGDVWVPGGDPVNAWTETFTLNLGVVPQCLYASNAQILDSSGRRVGGGIHGERVTGIAGQTYTVRGGDKNGGFKWSTSPC